MDSAPRPIAISFDLWGTLIGSHPDFKAHRNELLRRRLAPDVSPELFTATLRAADRAADEDSMASGADIGYLPRVESALHRLGVRTTFSPSDPEEMDLDAFDFARPGQTTLQTSQQPAQQRQQQSQPSAAEPAAAPVAAVGSVEYPVAA